MSVASQPMWWPRCTGAPCSGPRPERHERGFAAGAVAGAYRHSRTTVSDRVTEDIDHTD